MQVQQLTIGATAVLVSFDVEPTVGVRILARSDNTGDVYLGTTDAVTDETGALVAKGVPETSFPTTTSGRPPAPCTSSGPRPIKS